MHLWNEKPMGWLGITPGPLMAASECFTLRIMGKGGHGAAPHQSVDPIFAASQVISTLQSIVSRNTNPLDSAVVSVTSVISGEAHNVIPPMAELKGTIRTFKPDVREMVLNRFREIVQGVCHALDCQVEIAIQDLTPAVVNDPELTNRVQGVAKEVFPKFIQATTYQTMGSEDMAFMMDDIPGCYLFVGSANHEKGLDAKHHHPCFDFDENVLPKAAALMAAVATDLLSG
jgi:amidohydrolase